MMQSNLLFQQSQHLANRLILQHHPVLCLVQLQFLLVGNLFFNLVARTLFRRVPILSNHLALLSLLQEEAFL